MIEDQEIIKEFIAEAEEHLRSFEENLLRLEQSPEDLNLVKEMFRSAHTLKGNSAYMGLEEMAALCHEIENMLEPIRNGNVSAGTSTVNDLLSRLDRLKELVHMVKGLGTSYNVETRTEEGPPIGPDEAEAIQEQGDREDIDLEVNRFLLFEVLGATLCLPVHQVVEVTEPTTVSRLPYYAGRGLLGLINLRGEIVPLFDTALKLGIGKLDKIEHYVVGEESRGKVALAVGRVIGVNYITSFSIGEQARLINREFFGKYDTSLITPLNLEEIIDK
ncbi:MAG: hypothetical protein HPY52_16735 [Firmicutes bacterium]|nr:hypothetical protein [Bacillota bacterium]